MYAASSLARNAKTPAISSADADRPRGTSEIYPEDLIEVFCVELVGRILTIDSGVVDQDIAST
jgi:hypothetical protein